MNVLSVQYKSSPFWGRTVRYNVEPLEPDEIQELLRTVRPLAITDLYVEIFDPVKNRAELTPENPTVTEIPKDKSIYGYATTTVKDGDKLIWFGSSQLYKMILRWRLGLDSPRAVVMIEATQATYIDTMKRCYWAKAYFPTVYHWLDSKFGNPTNSKEKYDWRAYPFLQKDKNG